MTDTVRAAIVAKLSGITGIGVVHSYQRYASRSKQMADLYSVNGQLHGWYVRRLAQKDGLGPGQLVTEDTKWLIRGYMAVDDAAQSELVFDGLVDLVRVAFRINSVLEDPLMTPEPFTTRVENQSGATLEDSQPVLFCDVLCHSAKLILITRKRRLDQG